MNFLPDFDKEYLGKFDRVKDWYGRMFEIPAFKDTHQILFKLIEKSH